MLTLQIWSSLAPPRTEATTVELDEAGLRADGTQIGVDPLPYRLDYRLETGPDLVTRLLEARAAGAGWSRALTLEHDGRGGWSCRAETRGAVDLAAPGGATHRLSAALDCDLGLSPLTNLMPVRRHGLHRGPGAAELVAAWVSVPDLALHASAQRYEHLGLRPGGALVRYVDLGLFAGFVADLELDEEGLVVEYPGLTRRVGAAAG